MAHLPRAKSKKLRILLLRGLLGGAVGGLLIAAWSVLGQIELFQTNWDQWLLVYYLVVGLPFGLSSGGITAVTIWLIHHHTQVNLGPGIRTLTGTVIGIIGLIILSLMANKTNSISNFQLSHFFGLVLFGICVGGLPGLFVGRQSLGEFRSL